ncbi:class I SAM-dependent methyltransferase [Paenibacillus sp. N1-5-1-14]|uniref:class I SAM-dependent methyltransferase n=1 Tax=Paenibacillus radicibacter TaxID=2972488 RepID=UPI0021599BB0|nr:class I SAM-dependent methyltransferase [Paenibacillus radicibacter]MCR8641621.1 class I SAM-dependent methyltransferase [Paenibacillus radicibacter]
MIVTTSYFPSSELLAKAHKLAKELGWRFVPRYRESMESLRVKHNCEQILLVGRDQLQCFVGDAPPIYFHPSMAQIRVKRLMHDEQDGLVTAAGVEPGDQVLDCTAGLAADSVVLSYAVGVTGSVVALDSQLVICMLLAEGLQHYSSEVKALEDAMRRVEIKCSEHLTYLQQQPDKSVDIIYFDPMFRRPIEESSSISPLRQVANPDALTLEAVAEAKRVARKRVVMKEVFYSGEFARLGFTTVHRSGSKLAYGVITC